MEKKKYFKLGIIFILLSGLSFGIMLLIPFLDLNKQAKIIGTSASFIAMEVLFWVGSVLVGKELIQRYWKKLNPINWFKQKNEAL